jgi:ubiquinone/menaquinone biosynthesis C-methylase UbiE
MRAELEKNLSGWKGGERVKVVKGNAEDIKTDDASADAVIASQSFHW